jgi:hypothetical protein
MPRRPANPILRRGYASITRGGQLTLLSRGASDYGGSLRTTRAARSRARPLSTRDSMHLVLRSTQARGAWSFLQPRNQGAIRALSEKFGARFGVKVLSIANVGNHLHLQIRITNRRLYAPFVRALTGAIALRVTGRDRWKSDARDPLAERRPFWDLRPFTRILEGRRSLLTLRDYFALNRREARGFDRVTARWILRQERAFFAQAGPGGRRLNSG